MFDLSPEHRRVLRTTSGGSSADAGDLASDSKTSSRPLEHTTRTGQVKDTIVTITTLKGCYLLAACVYVCVCV